MELATPVSGPPTLSSLLALGTPFATPFLPRTFVQLATVDLIYARKDIEMASNNQGKSGQGSQSKPADTKRNATTGSGKTQGDKETRGEGKRSPSDNKK